MRKEEEEPTIEELLERTRIRDNRLRRHAMYALGRSYEGDKRTVEPLISFLYDEDRYVRKNAAEFLAKTRDKRAIEPLIEVLEDKIDYVRFAAIKALREIGVDKRVVEPLIEAISLKDEYVPARSEAAYALGETGDTRAVEPLIDLLKDEDIKWSVATALGNLRAASAVEPLIRLLDDQNDYCVNIVVKALGQINNEESVNALIGMLENKNVSEYVKNHVVETLLSLCDVKASKAVKAYRVKTMRKQEEYQPEDLLDEDKSVRWEAFWSLYETGKLDEINNQELIKRILRIGAENIEHDFNESFRFEVFPALGTKAVKPLCEVIENNEGDSRMRILAIESLAQIKDKKAVPALIKALHANDKYERSFALIALEDIEGFGELTDEKDMKQIVSIMHEGEWGSYRGESTYEILVELAKNSPTPILMLLESEDSYFRESATYALSELDLEESFESLFRAVNDEDKSVGEAAINKLKTFEHSQIIDTLIEAILSGRFYCNDDNYWSWDAFWDYAIDILEEEDDSRIVEPLLELLSEEYSCSRGLSPTSTKFAQVIYICRDLGEKALEPLKNASSSGMDRIQHLAAKILVRLNEKALQDVFNLLRQEPVDTIVVEILPELEDERAIEPLIEQLKIQTGDKRAVAGAISSFGEKAIVFLTKEIKNEDRKIREWVVWTLKEIVNDRKFLYMKRNNEIEPIILTTLVESLLEALNDEYPCVRKLAIEALEKSGNKLTVGSIKQALEKETDEEIKEEMKKVMLYLGKYGS